MRDAERLRQLAKQCRAEAEESGESAAENLCRLADAYDEEAERIEGEGGPPPAEP